MKKIIVLISSYILSQSAWAADASHTSATASLAKMGFGLLAVLAVMMLIAWGLKRAMPNGLGQNAVAKIVGGVSVGSRERVMVIEVAGRWIVVGVAPGQVTSLANIEQGAALEQAISAASKDVSTMPPFAQWLNKSVSKFKR